MKEGETYGQMVIHLPGQFRETASNHSNRTEQVYRYKEWARLCHDKSGGRYRQMGLQAETSITTTPIRPVKLGFPIAFRRKNSYNRTTFSIKGGFLMAEKKYMFRCVSHQITPPYVILEQIYDTWEEAEKLREIMADGTKMAIPKKPSLKYLEYTVEEVEV